MYELTERTNAPFCNISKMRVYRGTKLFLILTFYLTSFGLRAQNKLDKKFVMISSSNKATILIDTSDFEVVKIAARSLQGDIKDITDIEPTLTHYNNQINSSAIIVGTIGKSKIIDQLIKEHKIKVEAIKGKWEGYSIQLVQNPTSRIKQALVISGSDRRGTAFGVFELSRMIGVSPWTWWADARPKKSKQLILTLTKAVNSFPDVRYRGIFINNEMWGLLPWAAKNVDTDIKDIGPKTYTKVFELMLRLKSNLLWPAMHDVKAFFHYPQDPVIADRYGIIIGSSHCEQMLRSNVFEWVNNFEQEYGTKPGEWNYQTNRQQIYTYWDDRIKETKNYESIYTMGIRGVHDSGMLGPKDKAGKISLLTTAIDDQRGIFEKYFKKASDVPQIFCPYKEVLSLYQGGLKLPDDVTLVWVDDNHGYVRQLSTPAEQKRSGGAGMYYHISYWGAPHDYLWLSTISPVLMSYEMTKSYQFGTDRLWVLNVGDIKPNEMETQFFLDMAWDVKRWSPEKANSYSEFWAEQTFGKDVAKEVAELKNDFFKLAQNGKPEHLRMMKFDETAQNERLALGRHLFYRVDQLKTRIPKTLQSAYYQLIEYPIKGNYRMNEKVFYAEKSIALAKQKDNKALEIADKSLKAFEQIKALTKIYNKDISNGKWDGMMYYAPRDLPVYGLPPVATAKMVANPDSIPPSQTHKYLANYNGGSAEEHNSRWSFSVYANKYRKRHNLPNDSIITVKGLGLGGNSISRYPFTGKSYTTSDFAKAPYVEYSFKLNDPKKELLVQCLPTQAIHSGRALRMAVVIDNQAPLFADVNNPKEDEIWRENVLRGYSQAKFSFEFKEAAYHTVRIYILDTGLALSRIELK